MSQPTLFLVLGYGCRVTSAIERFLHVVARTVAKHPGPALLLTSGGYTALRSAPGISEAELMGQHLKALGVHWPLMMDRQARTTIENIRGAAELIERLPSPPSRVVIFCDAIRQQKISQTARTLLCVPFELHPVTLDRSLLQTAVQTRIAPFVDATLLHNPKLERLALRYIDLRIRLS